MALHVLSGGAAEGLFGRLGAEFERMAGIVLAGRFGAVGAMREALAAGAPCDVLVLTAELIRTLEGEGRAAAGEAGVLGRVRTAIAAPAGAAKPAISDSEQLRTLLASASAIHLPDPVRATAGIHFAGVLRQLGLYASLAARLRPHPNGMTAMRALAAEADPRAVGCTQVTEILATPGVAMVGALPPPFALETTYVATVATASTTPELARRLVAWLSGKDTATARAACGFE
ncbi:MAG: ABC transporter substrate-binding protein [Alphaproteobacteria bacterium]|nr:ABC transporter substrate-binding protein [Alphaproteobacteria bacterium]